jgi:predicted transposase/invertase (TIGR01784 family)
MNDLVFKYVYGQDTKSSKRALKGLLEVFLDLKIEDVEIKNSCVPIENIKAKDVRLDIVALLDDHTKVDIEMQMESTIDDLQARFEYYLCRMVTSEELKGMKYKELKPSYVLVFLNENLFDDEDMYQVFQFRNQKNKKFKESDYMYIITVEMDKLSDKENMDVKEEYVYYLKNCQNAQNDSKIKRMIEKEEAIRMSEERLKEITNDEWDNLNRAFDEMKKNEREVREKYYQDMYREEGRAKGKQETLIDNVRKLTSVLSNQQIADTLGLSLSEVENYLK